MAMMAGTAYCTSSLRIRSVPSSMAAPLISVITSSLLSFLALSLPDADARRHPVVYFSFRGGTPGSLPGTDSPVAEHSGRMESPPRRPCPPESTPAPRRMDAGAGVPQRYSSSQSLPSLRSLTRIPAAERPSRMRSDVAQSLAARALRRSSSSSSTSGVT